MLMTTRLRKMMSITRTITDPDWRYLLLLLPTLSLLVYFFLSTSTNSQTLEQRLPSLSPLKSIIFRSSSSSSSSQQPPQFPPPTNPSRDLGKAKIAVCLVGGARRFELTGPSIIDRVLKQYPNSDLFLNSPFDKNSYKFSLLRDAPKIAAIRIFEPNLIKETDSMQRVLTPANSPNGIQGLVQYFTLVEGCLTLVKSYEAKRKLTYDWIVRTRVDGYWSAPLSPSSFIPSRYVVPPGSSYGGLNDRLGVGDRKTSTIALSRISLIPSLDSAGYRQLNSESAFKAQLTTHKVPYTLVSQPFCIVTDRRYGFPLGQLGVPVASISSEGPLSGAKCRPCREFCSGSCVAKAMNELDRGWSWTEWGKGTKLCDAQGEWEKGWEELFDGAVGEKLAEERRKVRDLKVEECVVGFGQMKEKAGIWDTPPVLTMCRLAMLGETKMS